MAKAVVVDADYLKEIDKARRDLRALISNKNCAPIMLRLAWHDAGTYDVNTKTGGPNGSIRNEEEYSHGANNGLKIALEFCEQVKSKHPKITYADLYQVKDNGLGLIPILIKCDNNGKNSPKLFPNNQVDKYKETMNKRDDQ